MTSSGANQDAQTLRFLFEALERYGVEGTALTGGVAFGVWATPRYTKDFDLCARVPLSAVDKILARFDGLRVGPSELPDVLRFTIGAWDVDLFVVKTPYYEECLRRAIDTTLFDVPVRVVTAEDLLIHKLIKLHTDRRRILQDAADIRALLSEQTTDHAYLRQWLPADQAELLEQALTLPEEELVARLKSV